VYDNELDKDDGEDPTTFLTKGSIKVHSAKGRRKTAQEKEEVMGNDFESTTSSITAYPNPMQEDGFWLSFPVELEGQTLKATMYDYNGRFLISRSFESPIGGGDIFWNLNHGEWDQGVYILKLKSDSKEYQIYLMKN